MLHCYMKPILDGYPPRSAYHEILEEEQMEDHVVEVLPICHCIVAIERDDISIR